MAASWTDTFFCDEYLLKRGESHGSFLSKLHHLKHFFDALDLCRFFWPIATFYLLYVASGFLWILAFPDDPFSLKQIQVGLLLFILYSQHLCWTKNRNWRSLIIITGLICTIQFMSEIVGSYWYGIWGKLQIVSGQYLCPNPLPFIGVEYCLKP